MNRLKDKCRGSLIGGAVGDALGYEVEFMHISEILQRFGKEGIKDYELNRQGIAEFSDDTQMTLFTAEGLLQATEEGKVKMEEILPYISKAYENWYITQTHSFKEISGSWIAGIKELWARRAPGLTCMNAMENISTGIDVENNSKGCGGVMRVAPIAIFAAANPELFNIEDAAWLAGSAAEITHKHPLSTYSSIALAMIVAECIRNEKIDREKFSLIVDKAILFLENHFKDDTLYVEFKNLIQKSLELALSDCTDAEGIVGLGAGWVAEETLAIAIFSVMRHIDDFERCICCAVNHSGDSDSTGAVAGNIIGGILGYGSIPRKYLNGLELHDIIITMADDLGGLSPDEQKKERYTPSLLH